MDESPYGPKDYGFDPIATPDRCPNAHRGTLIVYHGNMFSGKTTALNGELSDLSVQNLRVIKLTHQVDQRTDVAISDESGSTHNPCYNKLPPNIICRQVTSLREVDVSKFHVIGVDEAQFFDDLVEAVEYWVEILGKHVRVAGLNGDFQKRKFGHILDLIPKADESRHLHARCRICMDELEQLNFRGNILSISGPFTKRLGLSTSQIEIGGASKYIPVCRYHHAFSL
jgi:thymidine kinase